MGLGGTQAVGVPRAPAAALVRKKGGRARGPREA